MPANISDKLKDDGSDLEAFLKTYFPTMSSILAPWLSPIFSALCKPSLSPFGGLSPVGFTTAATTSTTACTLGQARLTARMFKQLERLPYPLATYRMAELFAIAEACFERSIDALATYHRLPRRAIAGA